MTELQTNPGDSTEGTWGDKGMTKSEQYCYDQGRREEQTRILEQSNDWFDKNISTATAMDALRAIATIIQGEKP